MTERCEGDWAKVSLEDLAAPIRNALVGGPFGSELVSADYSPTGVAVIRGENLTHGRWVDGDFAFVPPEKAERLAANTAGPFDIIFTQRGANHYKQVAVVPAGAERFVISQSQMKLTVDLRKADPLFAYYLFRAPVQQEYLQRHAIQTGVPHTNLSILRKMPLGLPPLSVQHAIVDILSTLDDKIELNRQMNGTLEAMARAIFKSWFVDFDPVRAKAEGRQPRGMDPATAAQFPDSFKASPVGEAPTGWGVGTVSELLSLERDIIDPEDYPLEGFDLYSIPAFDEGRVPHLETGEQIKSTKFLVPSSCVLLSKLNPRIPRVWLPAAQRERRVICSTEFLVAVPRPGVPVELLYGLLTSTSFLEVFATLVTGTSGSHQRVRPEDLLGIATVLPPPETATRFASAVRPILQSIDCHLAESQTLAALRDTLLPKLVSGEIRLKDTERVVGATT